MVDYKRLLFTIIICEAAGIAGSLITTIGPWYDQLIKPWFNPPSWVFGPVWTTLYLMMGVALYLIWEDKDARTAFWIQLGLNAIWTPIFFGFRQIELAAVEIIILWIAILITIRRSYKVNKTASYLLIPYLVWVSFAAILNISLAVLN